MPVWLSFYEVLVPIRVRLLRDRIDAALGLLLAQALETDDAVHQRKQRVIATDAAVRARMDVGAALTVEDVASQHKLAVGALGAQALGLAVAAIVGGTGALLMREELKIHRKHLLASILVAVPEYASGWSFRYRSAPGGLCEK